MALLIIEFCENLFIQNRMVSNPNTFTLYVFADCEGEQSSLTLTKDANGEVMVDDIFRDPLTGIIKQKHIRFEGNEALEST